VRGSAESPDCLVHRQTAWRVHVVDVLGLGPPRDFVGEFLIVDMGNGVSLDYANWRDGDLFEIITQPYGAETEASGG
jgi:hypothetical protein